MNSKTKCAFLAGCIAYLVYAETWEAWAPHKVLSR
jgi:hypothetical protein